MTWRVARSLDKLLSQINAEAPNRSKAADGAIGDAAHAASVSDHNPDGAGVVRARDFTDDAAGGMDALVLREQLRKSRDPRIKYVISEGKMFSSYASFPYGPFEWRPYTGSNGHFHHLHLSVVADSRADDASPWAIDLTPAPASSIPNLPKPTKPKPAPKPTASMPAFPGLVRRGSKGAPVRKVQQRLKDRGWRIAVDGDFGPGTEAIVRAFQSEKRLTSDGVVGPNTWRALWTATVTK